MIEIPSPAEIARRRHTIGIVLRCLAIFSAGSGAVAMGSWMLEGFMDGDFWDLSYYSTRAMWSVGGGGGAVVLFLAARPIAIAVVPRGRLGCPCCGYDVRREAVCPECGNDLDPREFHPRLTHGRGLRAQRVHLVATWLRVGFVVVGALICVVVVGMYIESFMWGWYDYAYVELYMLQMASYLLVCLSGFLLAVPMARLIVPPLPRELRDAGPAEALKAEAADPE